MSFDEATLTHLLTQAARAAFTALRAAYPDETFYAYALYTTPEYQFISPLVCGEQGLRKVAERYDANNVDGEMESLRWSPADSPYLGEGEEHFAEVAAFMSALPHIYELPKGDFGARVAQVKTCCFAALKQLDADGFFGEGAARDAVTVNVLQGDQSNRSRLDNARILNPDGPWERLAHDMEVTREVGTFTALGPAAYQMTGVATCGTLMATGGQNEVYLFDGDRMLAEAELDASIWQVALGSDGAVVSAGPKAFHIALDGTVTPTGLAHADQIRALAFRPDDGLLVTADWKGTVIATQQRKERWRMDHPTTAMTWSADTLWIVGNDITAVDPATGTIHKTLELDQDGARAIALAPDGSIAIGIDDRGTGAVLLLDPDGALRHRLAIPKPLPESAKTGDYQPTACPGLAFSPDGSKLATVHTNGELHVWNPSTGARLTTLRARHESLSACAWRDEKHVALCGRDVDEGPAVYVFEV